MCIRDSAGDVQRAGCGGKQSALGADGDGLHIAGIEERLVLQSLVELGHDPPPHDNGRVRPVACQDNLILGVEAAPDARGVVRGVTGKVTVVIVGRRAGLTGDVHTRQPGRSAGTGVDRVL